MRKHYSTLTVERLRAAIDYNPETGLFISKITAGRKVAGSPIGKTIRKSDGYIVFFVDNVPLQAHRAAWFYVYGTWPAADIDHINGVRHDNRIANLRATSRSVNLQNQRRPQRNNNLGTLGVYKRRSGKYRAHISINNKAINLGEYDTPEQAHRMYLAAKKLLHPKSPLVKNFTDVDAIKHVSKYVVGLV